MQKGFTRTEPFQNCVAGMIVLNGSQVHWTREIEEAMATKGNEGIKEYWEKLLLQLQDMVILVRGKLSKMARTSIGALAVIDVHARDTTKELYDHGISESHAFEYKKAMRFYWEPSEGGDPDPAHRSSAFAQSV